MKGGMRMIIKLDEFERNMLAGAMPNAASIEIIVREDENDTLVSIKDSSGTTIAWISQDR
jgi:hypothetical protein